MNDDGFERTVRAHKDRVYSYAVWMLRNRDEAGDVAQEALLKLWENRPAIIEDSARAWLLRTTHNLCIDRMRRRAVRQEASPEATLPALPDPSPGPERRAGSSETIREIGRALERLSPRDRSVVLMREVQGMSYDEIAGVLDVPLGTLKALLHRARERLRRDLTEAGVQP